MTGRLNFMLFPMIVTSWCIIISGMGKDTMFTFDESFWSHDGYEDDGTGYLRLGRERFGTDKPLFFASRISDITSSDACYCMF